MHPTSTTGEASLKLFGYWIQIGEYRERCEQEDMTVPGRGQQVLTVLLQFTSVLACYYISPPLELQYFMSAIRSENKTLYTIKCSGTRLAGNRLSLQ